MRTDYILSIDPGLSTGIALLSYSPEEVPELVGAWQIGGGLAGFLDFFSAPSLPLKLLGSPFYGLAGSWRFGRGGIVISEKFQPINHSNYALTTASVEPLRIEGAMVALGMMPDYTVEEKRWRKPIDQYLFGGKTKAEKKKRQHAFLKASGFYKTGKDLGSPDADDFRSSVAHGLGYLARVVKHKPTYDLISDWTSK